jgi:Fic family protein
LNITGKKSQATYHLSDHGILHRPFDIAEYSNLLNGTGSESIGYNFKILDILAKEEIFFETEIEKLDDATLEFHKNANGKTPLIEKKELERFIIELSWKSSKIEGNTYTLLDTEKLIKDGIEAVGKTKDEAVMILNHKKAFSYILECIGLKKDLLCFSELVSVHELLVEGLGVSKGIRKSLVGITGTKYLPLGISSQLEEQVRKLVEIVKSRKDPYSKGLITILGLSYIQAFEDGNKRTSRMFSNAILLQNSHAPLSYRSVDEKDYREAVLIFYEKNSLEAFKHIFIDQYIFACKNYNIG